MCDLYIRVVPAQLCLSGRCGQEVRDHQVFVSKLPLKIRSQLSSMAGNIAVKLQSTAYPFVEVPLTLNQNQLN